MIKALLCDIDGTLVQSNWLHAQAWRDAFAVMGLELETDAIRRQIGKGGDELIPVFVPWWKQEQIEKPLKAYRKFVFQQDYRHQVQPLPSARDLVQRVHQAGITFTLASSSEPDDLELMKQLLGIEGFVDRQTGSADAPRAKPHPDIFAVAIAKSGHKPHECLALGDTPWDAESAGKAGVRTVGVTTGGWSREELMAAGCIAVYDGPEDLLAHFEQSPLMRTGLQL